MRKSTTTFTRENYGGWFETLLCVVLSLATARQSAKRRVLRLSSCRPVTNDTRQKVRCRGRVVAMSPCRSAQIEGLAFRRTITRRLACFASNRTTVRQRYAKCTKSATIENSIKMHGWYSFKNFKSTTKRNCTDWNYSIHFLFPTKTVETCIFSLFFYYLNINKSDQLGFVAQVFV
jgi:hypothetical protein